MAEDFEISLGEDFERQMTCINDVNVYKVPPLKQADGYRATAWEGNQMWRGRLRVLSKGTASRIVLDDPNTGNVFAECPLDNPNAVEKVIDSSRYFVIRVVNGTKHAFIGIGFETRNMAFDFNVAVEDSKKNEKEFVAAKNAPKQTETPVITSSGTDYSLQPGQKITINIPGTGATRKKRTVPSGGLNL